MVWLYRSPIPVGRREGHFTRSIAFYLPSLRLEEGVGVGQQPVVNPMNLIPPYECVLSVHRTKKVLEIPVPSRDVTTKLSLGGNNDVITELFLPRGSLVSDIPAGDGKLVNLFLRCVWTARVSLGFFPVPPGSFLSWLQPQIITKYRGITRLGF
jgi:hypothetical protein